MTLSCHICHQPLVGAWCTPQCVAEGLAEQRRYERQHQHTELQQQAAAALGLL